MALPYKIVAISMKKMFRSMLAICSGKLMSLIDY